MWNIQVRFGFCDPACAGIKVVNARKYGKVKRALKHRILMNEGKLIQGIFKSRDRDLVKVTRCLHVGKIKDFSGERVVKNMNQINSDRLDSETTGRSWASDCGLYDMHHARV